MREIILTGGGGTETLGVVIGVKKLRPVWPGSWQ